MKNDSIKEKYKMFNITKANQSKFEISNNYNFNKCSVLKQTNIRYYNSTENLKKN